MKVVTYVAPVNIAVIKYWGKRDESLILPVNDSISATLDTAHLCATTTIKASTEFEENEMLLNGRLETFENPRLQMCLKEIKKRAKLSEEMKNWKIHICSVNNFPTAAGLASSAAGYACLAVALAKLYNVDGDISTIARVGSGSACRSVYGGFVRWHMGSDPAGSDSIAKPIVSENHWPEIRILVLVVSDSKKKVSSKEAMKRTMMTTELLKFRAEHTVPARINQIQDAIINKNFQTFAELTMKDSNEMHATCVATYPPCVYMNDTSHLIVELIHLLNSSSEKTKIAYTFDAGPNATLFLLEEDVKELLDILDYYFPPIENADVDYHKGIPIVTTIPTQEILQKINFTRQDPGKLKYIIHTRIGGGPTQI